MHEQTNNTQPGKRSTNFPRFVSFKLRTFASWSFKCIKRVENQAEMNQVSGNVPGAVLSTHSVPDKEMTSADDVGPVIRAKGRRLTWKVRWLLKYTNAARPCFFLHFIRINREHEAKCCFTAE